jgi:hypothetical protein
MFMSGRLVLPKIHSIIGRHRPIDAAKSILGGMEGASAMGGIAQFVRYLIIAAAGAQAAYWLYTFRFLIAVNSNPLGDGLEFAAIVPFGFIFLALVVPALLLGLRGRMLPLAAALAVAGLILNVLLFIEIASELTHDGARPLRL